jgi:ribA/ribD-fused uncharacterized protein
MNCAICHLPKDQHAEAFGIRIGPQAGTLNNCALRCTGSTANCAMCSGSCYPRHTYTSRVIDSFRGPYAYLSNFYLCDVVIYGWTFPSAEHAYQAMKAADPATAWPWFANRGKTPGEAKRLGRKILIRPDWESVKVGFMRAIVFDKFNRHIELNDALQSTGDALLIEGNDWGDTFWGVCNGVGENQLGKILMETRLHLEIPF